MKLVVQRVKQASVTIDEIVNGAIGQGLMVLVGIANDDTEKDLEYCVKKLIQLRIFSDDNGLMNLSVMDIKGELLLVSQFTLIANTRKGNRPSFINAARPDMAIPMYEKFCEQVADQSQCKIATGVFGADMQVALVNDGPVTIVIDSKEV